MNLNHFACPTKVDVHAKSVLRPPPLDPVLLLVDVHSLGHRLEGSSQRVEEAELTLMLGAVKTGLVERPGTIGVVLCSESGFRREDTAKGEVRRGKVATCRDATNESQCALNLLFGVLCEDRRRQEVGKVFWFEKRSGGTVTSQIEGFCLAWPQLTNEAPGTRLWIE